jgi:hypothetical protein
VVDADDKRRARLNCIAHLLSRVPYRDVRPQTLKLPPRQRPDPTHVRPPIESMRWIPEVY